VILMNDFRAEPEELLQKEMVAVERVLRSGWYVLVTRLKHSRSNGRNVAVSNRHVNLSAPILLACLMQSNTQAIAFRFHAIRQ
jgi:hypothetical protein